MKHDEDIRCIGEVECTIEWLDGRKEIRNAKNTVLVRGRSALASSLANEYGEVYQFFINRMIFGNGGTATSVPKYVNADRNGLFGLTLLSKPVSSTVDVNFPYQVVFTSVVAYDEANGDTINEMALQMNTGDLYSMVTFGDISKTSSMQITWSWSISFI